MFLSSVSVMPRALLAWPGVINGSGGGVSAALLAVTRLMANVSNNVNQLAKFANSEGQFPGLQITEHARGHPSVDSVERVRTRN